VFCVVDDGDEHDDITDERGNADDNRFELPPDSGTSDAVVGVEPQASGDVSSPAAETIHQLDDNENGDENDGHGDVLEDDGAAAAAAGREQSQSTQSEAAGNNSGSRSPGPGFVSSHSEMLQQLGCS